MDINKNRLWQRLETLGRIGRHADGSITRLSCTDEDAAARDWIIGEMTATGLDTRVDAVGNIIGVLHGQEAAAPVVLSGSHYDTVRHGGRFDGTLGLLSALEAAQTMVEQGKKIKHTLCIIGYKDEEGNRFGFGMAGSRCIAGIMDPEGFKAADQDGITMGAAMEAAGYHPQDYTSCDLNPIKSSVELHIEQARVLDGGQLSLGVVEGIAHLLLYEVKITGYSGHAGANPMKGRQDPVVAMSEWISAVTREASKEKYCVATVGIIHTWPGSFNVICESVTFTLDIRSMFMEEIDACMARMEEISRDIEQRHGVRIEITMTQELSGCTCDGAMKDRLDAIMERNHIPHCRLMSGAGHDSQNLARVCPCAMIFVRSVDGYSHRKEEYSTPEDCANGAQVLYEMLLSEAVEVE